MAKKMLILGGTGIVGSSIADVALEYDYAVTATGADQGILDGTVSFVHNDETHLLKGFDWDVIVDVFTFDREHARKTYATFRQNCGHLFVISSTLVYDRSKISYTRIPSHHVKAKKGAQGGYVDHKLELEEFWEHVQDIPWTMLRPYHILGRGSYLGCLPPHNRDPDLMKTMILKRRISLCDGGRIPLNLINPRDIGAVIIHAANCEQAYFKAYNVVNPEEILARDYYKEIASMQNIGVAIHNIPAEYIWRFGNWKLTTVPHLYDVSDLEKDIGFVPRIGLRESLREAMKFQPQCVKRTESAVYRRMHLPPEPLLNEYYED